MRVTPRRDAWEIVRLARPNGDGTAVPSQQRGDRRTGVDAGLTGLKSCRGGGGVLEEGLDDVISGAPCWRRRQHQRRQAELIVDAAARHGAAGAPLVGPERWPGLVTTRGFGPRAVVARAPLMHLLGAAARPPALRISAPTWPAIFLANPSRGRIPGRPIFYAGLASSFPDCPFCCRPSGSSAGANLFSRPIPRRGPLVYGPAVFVSGTVLEAAPHTHHR